MREAVDAWARGGSAEHGIAAASARRQRRGGDTAVGRCTIVDEWCDDGLVDCLIVTARDDDGKCFYARFSESGGGTAVDLQGVKFDTNGGGILPLEKYISALRADGAAAKLNPKYRRTLRAELESDKPCTRWR